MTRKEANPGRGTNREANVPQHNDLIRGERALAARRKARVQRKRAQGAAGNKNPFKEADVGYDQEQEVPGDFCEHQGRSTP